MKNYNIVGVHCTEILEGRGSRKTNMERGLPKKGGGLDSLHI